MKLPHFLDSSQLKESYHKLKFVDVSITVISELTLQDGRGKKMENIV